MVFVFHIINSGLQTFPPLAAPVSQFSLESMQAGVELFFGISGFVIVGAIGRASTAWGYLWERATRIFPVLWASLVFIALASIISHVPPPGDASVLHRPLTFAANFLAPPPFFHVSLLFPATWSLGYEFTFYILTAVAAFAPWKKPGQFIAIAIGVVLLILFPRGLMFVAGVLIARGKLDHPFLHRLARHPALFLVVFLIGWRMLRALTVSDHAEFLSPLHIPIEKWLLVEPLVLLVTAAGGIALLGIARGQGLLSRFLDTPLMQWGGTISYSFYLWHPISVGIVKTLLRKAHVFPHVGPFAQALLAVASLPVALFAAYVSCQILEKRLTKWLRRFQNKSAHAPSTSVTAVEGSAS